MDLVDLSSRVAALDAALQPIARRPVPLDDLAGWAERMRAAPPATEEAGVAGEAVAVLRALIQVYADGGDAERAAVRELFDRYRAFRRAVHLPERADTAAGLRARLLHLSARDHDGDTRDELLRLRDMLAEAEAAGVDADPVLAEVAALSSDVDRYGMGSIRTILIRCMGTSGDPGRHGRPDI
ncbi:hypothetical protein [Phytohabitans suffuscus]|uniref:Uncharacterized protein n=1 Tax=Phytohabitans suffuscus TaxID=624315 RepID=A0A6F8YQY4_9ACTN|nr:hypothetical protein [Phytohabitans suffuscus]BCB88469.1 hypothetical protein Psuf_057820 [Phytohabitans suffuscus]